MRHAFLFFAGLLFGAGGILWFFFERDMEELRSRVATGSEIVQTAYGAIEYAEAGEGPPVLVIHGSGGGFDQGLEMVGRLAGWGYRLIVPSRFGYLGSNYPDKASPELQARRLRQSA